MLSEPNAPKLIISFSRNVLKAPVSFYWLSGAQTKTSIRSQMNSKKQTLRIQLFGSSIPCSEILHICFSSQHHRLILRSQQTTLFMTIIKCVKSMFLFQGKLHCGCFHLIGWLTWLEDVFIGYKKWKNGSLTFFFILNLFPGSSVPLYNTRN